MVILVLWLLWKHRNACVFEGGRPCMLNLVWAFEDECHLRCLASARTLSSRVTVWLRSSGLCVPWSGLNPSRWFIGFSFTMYFKSLHSSARSEVDYL
ncbi:hypothetical protein PR202_ga21355 [Eleusine coracana subsp. coracana]|uniref:Secreted protein n=1 Tax=Eleusine coracana subsp. coracana TaxID=191504 RepID=A0AAV5D0B3_ELECO|nr:hypothetical protein PR202_ga21355 [Eleusine coracana subsp. coracana]